MGFLKIKEVILFLLLPGISLLGDSPVRITNLGSFNRNKPVYLTGYGLVVGLSGTGDGRGSPQTQSALANFNTRMGLQTDASELKSKNAALVAITATAETGAREGDMIDITLSSMGDAKSLAGGTLVRSFLRDWNDNPVVVAQGPVSVGGYAFSTGSGGEVQKNHPSVGRIPSGGMIMQSIPPVEDSLIHFTMNEPDQMSLAKIKERIWARDSAWAVQISGTGLLIDIGEMAFEDFLAEVETLTVENLSPARVVINEKTGTVVIGGDVRISPCAVSHGGITIEITSFPEISQPLPFTEGGETVTAWNDSLFVSEESGNIFSMGGEGSVSELVQGLNVIGASPRDIIAIFQAIKRAGALKAELVVM